MSTMTQLSGRTALRRPWFALDAVVTGGNAVIYLAAASALPALLGGDAATYRWLGGFLALYTVAVAAYAWTAVPARAGWAVVAANEVWVVASLVVAATGMLELGAVGRAWAVAQALVVGGFALLQARALRAR